MGPHFTSSFFSQQFLNIQIINVIWFCKLKIHNCNRQLTLVTLFVLCRLFFFFWWLPTIVATLLPPGGLGWEREIQPDVLLPACVDSHHSMLVK